MKKLLMSARRWRVRTQRDQITVLLIAFVQQLTYMPLYTLLGLFDLGFRDWLILYTLIGVPVSLTACSIVFKLRVPEEAP